MGLFGKRVFDDRIENLKMRSSWIIWVGLNTITGVLISKRRQEAHMKTEAESLSL